MKPVFLCLLSFALLSVGTISCKKKTEKKKTNILTATDTMYMYAVIDSFVFTGTSADAFYSGGTENPYIVISAQTGSDSSHKIISLRIDNFPHAPGVYPITANSEAKASYKRSSKTIETADSGSITITSLGSTIKGSFRFYTEHHSVSSGTFSAQ